MMHEYNQYLTYETYMRHIAMSGDNESSVDKWDKTTTNCKHKHIAHMTQDPMCHNMWRRMIFLSFLPFIYHMYFYSWSHDWQPFFSHMTHLESYVTFSRDSSSHDSCWLWLTYSDSLVFHFCFISLISVSSFVSWLTREHLLFSLPIVLVTSLSSVTSIVPVTPLFTLL